MATSIPYVPGGQIPAHVWLGGRLAPGLNPSDYFAFDTYGRPIFRNDWDPSGKISGSSPNEDPVGHEASMAELQALFNALAARGAPSGVVSSLPTQPDGGPAEPAAHGVQPAPVGDLPIGPLSPLVAAVRASSAPLTAGGATISRALQRRTPDQNIALIQAALARFLGSR